MGSEEKPLVFISCGQFTDDEISLGKAVESLIRDETSFDAYFAEQQNSLDGLTTNILSNLNRAAGFIAIMHHRGRFDTPHGHVIRGSVWVEQEIAIAAFIQRVLGRRIEVAVYIQRSIGREGIRQQLRLKPVEFDQPDDVLADLRERVRSWAIEVTPPQPLQAEWRFEYLKPPVSNRHDYRLTVELINTGSSIIAEWMAEVWFPAQFIEGGSTSERFVRLTLMTPNIRPPTNESSRIIACRRFRSTMSSRTRTGPAGMKASGQCQACAFVCLRRTRSLGRLRYRS